MVKISIENPVPKEFEGKDLIFGRLTERKRFEKLNTAEESRATKEHKPYCFRCAKADHEERQEHAWNRNGRKTSISIENTKVSTDFKQYWAKTHFDVLDSTEIVEDKLLDGLKQSFVTGRWERFKCKERGGSIKVKVSTVHAQKK